MKTKNWIKCLMSMALVVGTGGVLEAGNGYYFASYGARQSGLGGAVVALGDSVMDLNSNPAHLAGVRGSQFEMGFEYQQATLSYQDRFVAQETDLNYGGKYQEKPGGPAPYIGYMSEINHRSGWGIALYFHAGGGGGFNNLRRTVPGGKTINEYLGVNLGALGESRQYRETLNGSVSKINLSPGYALRFGKLKLGAALDFVYGMQTSETTYSDIGGFIKQVPGMGTSYKSDPGLALSGKVGMVYEFTENFRIAYNYQARTKINFDGDMEIRTLDPNAQQFYRSTGVSNTMQFPESHRAGFVYETDKFLVSFDMHYIKWSNVLRTSKITLEDSWFDTPFGFQTNQGVSNINMRDQTVFALGMQYKPGNIAYRVGYNHGSRTLTADSVGPLALAISEHHVSAGIGLELADSTLDISLMYTLPEQSRGSNSAEWTASRAMFSMQDNRSMNFDYTVGFSAIALQIGYTKKWK